MNKKFLGLLILPALTLAACSDSGYKKVKYLNVNGAELVDDKGIAVRYISFATYKLDAATLALARESFVNFPESFLIEWDSFWVDPNEETVPTKFKVAPETHAFDIQGTAFTLDLVAGSSVTVKSYTEYLYKPSAKSYKKIEHRFEGFPGEAVYYPDGVEINVKPDPTFPTADYELYGSKTIKDETLETYKVLGEDANVEYALEK